jgi:hypothetical protein
LADALSPLLLDGLLCSWPLGCCFAGIVVGLGCWGQSLSLLYLLLFLCLFQVTHYYLSGL